MVPGHIMFSLKQYAFYGQQTGSCLLGILSNDIYNAVGRADNETAANLADIIKFIIRELPANSYGSKFNVDEWLASGGLVGKHGRKCADDWGNAFDEKYAEAMK